MGSKRGGWAGSEYGGQQAWWAGLERAGWPDDSWPASLSAESQGGQEAELGTGVQADWVEGR